MRSKLIGAAVATALSVALLIGSGPAAAQVGISLTVDVVPPELPVYEQPEIPGEGYIWTPGYWAWAEDGSGYYWVPGTWVEAPQPGYLWTPGYWGFEGGAYAWHGGYWGPTIGFYGGVSYGFGYFGHGYDGGYWDHGHFQYNTVYNHFGSNVHITNVYNKTVVNNVTINHVSFNGGNGGIQARPTPQEVQAEHAPHLQPVAAQMHQVEVARSNPDLRLSANHGHPPIAATARPGEFSGRGVVAAHGAPAVANHTAQAGRGPEAPRTEVTHGATPAPRVTRPPVQNTPTRPQAQYEAPHTEAPRTEAPRTEAPRTEAPRTEAPRTEAPRAPSPPVQREQRPAQPERAAPREPEKREEPHGK